jgi:hypothetical protein
VTDTAIAPSNLFQATGPLGVIDQATRVAGPLAKVLVDQNLAPKIGDRRYVMVEGWTLLGNMLGVFPLTVWTHPIEEEVTEYAPDGEVIHRMARIGWEACVEAHTLSGAVVGRAEAQCTRHENRWQSRDDYALRAMAQTRATSRAMRGPLGFVVKLAGMEATAYEEMPPDGK